MNKKWHYPNNNQLRPCYRGLDYVELIGKQICWDIRVSGENEQGVVAVSG